MKIVNTFTPISVIGIIGLIGSITSFIMNITADIL